MILTSGPPEHVVERHQKGKGENSGLGHPTRTRIDNDHITPEDTSDYTSMKPQ